MHLFSKWEKIKFSYCMTDLTIGFCRSTQVVEFSYVAIYAPILAVEQKRVWEHFTNYSSPKMESSRFQWYLFRRRKIVIIADYSQLHLWLISNRGISHTESCFDISRMLEHLIESYKKRSWVYIRCKHVLR